jgi:hypothetical protein
MLNDIEIRRLIGALYAAGRLAQDRDSAPLDDLDAEQYDALQAAHGAALALEVVLGDRPADDLTTGILDRLYTLVKLPKPVKLPNDYTVRVLLADGDGRGWTEVYKRDTYSSGGTPENAAYDICATTAHVRYDNGVELPWRITVQAGHGAHHRADLLYTLTPESIPEVTS